MSYIVDGATRMKQLIEDLLEYSRVGSRAREFQPVDSLQSLAKALANLRAAHAAAHQRPAGVLPPRLAEETFTMRLSHSRTMVMR